MNPIIIAVVVLAGGIQPVVQGNLKLNLDPLVYQGNDSTITLEMAYEIPYSSLSFVRDTGGFAARYRLTLEVKNKDGNIIVGDVWERKIKTRDYQTTVNRESVATEFLRIAIPADARRAELTISDLFSERWAVANFPLQSQPGSVVLRLLKSGQPNPTRSYGIADTVTIAAEAKTGDSIRFVILKGKKVAHGGVVPFAESAGTRRAVFALPVADPTGTVHFNSGEYTVEASVFTTDGLQPVGRSVFRIDLPFYYDDSTWETKIDQLLYIASPEEMRKLKTTPRTKRLTAWQEFWRPWDPNPSTLVNEKEEEYFSRIAYCEEHFRKGDRGYRSDRARVYVQYGPPDQVESRPFEVDRPAEEIWYYFSQNRSFRFVDRFGSGEFVLVNPRGG